MLKIIYSQELCQVLGHRIKKAYTFQDAYNIEEEAVEQTKNYNTIYEYSELRQHKEGTSRVKGGKGNHQ